MASNCCIDEGFTQEKSGVLLGLDSIVQLVDNFFFNRSASVSLMRLLICFLVTRCLTLDGCDLRELNENMYSDV